jgi:hypothetical protein
MSFFDHFLGSSLNARWTALTSGNGRMSVANSAVLLQAPASVDAAAIYRSLPLNKTVSQLMLAAVSTNPLSLAISLITKSTAPVTEAASVFATRVVARFSGVGGGYQLTYVDNLGITQYWNPSVNAWTSTPALALTLAVAGDYHVFGIEFDATSGRSRFRLIGIHQTIANGFTARQGLRIFALTDWVNWSAARPTASPLWLVLGDPRTDAGASRVSVEWVRSADGPRQYLYTNCKEGGHIGIYGIRTSWGYDGKVFVPKDRSTVEVSPAKDPWVVFDGATYHLFYVLQSNHRIARATALAPTGPWTFRDYVTPAPVTGQGYVFPAVVYAPWEVPYRQWQVLTPLSGVAPQAIHLFTAAAPSGPWTDHGGVLTGNGPVPIHRNGQWELWFTRSISIPGGNAAVTGFRAIGPSLDQLVEDGVGARLGLNNQRQALADDLNGSSARVIDTSGFAVDMPCYVALDNTSDNWAGSKIRAIVPNVSIELMHRLVGFTVAGGNMIFGGAAGNQQIRQIRQVGNRWWVYLTTFGFARLEPTFSRAFQEGSSLLIVPNGSDLADLNASMYSWVDNPIVYYGSWNNQRSNENCTLINPATPQSVG